MTWWSLLLLSAALGATNWRWGYVVGRRHGHECAAPDREALDEALREWESWVDEGFGPTVTEARQRIAELRKLIA